MAHDANRLIYRIKTALKGESSGQETAKLAYHFAEAVDQANQRLKDCSQALEQENILDAFVSARLGANLLDTVDSLDFAEKQDWDSRCVRFSWRVAEPLDHPIAAKLKESFAKQSDVKDWLYGEYRARTRSKQKLEAYQMICALNAVAPDDAEVAEERQRARARLLEIAEAELEAALQELLPAESARAALERYEAYGLEFPSDSDHYKNAIDAIRKAEAQEIVKSIDDIVSRSEEASDPSKWLELENDFFACDAKLAEGLRAELDPAKRDAFNQVGTALSRTRGAFESNILVQSAIDELNARLRPGRGKLGPSKTNYREAAERLASRQDQAKKLGYPIPPQLQNELKKALTEAKHRRAKRVALIGVGGIAACSLLAWMGIGITERAEETARIDEALAALEAESARSSLPAARSVLAAWDPLISEKAESHPLRQSAQELQAWIDQQSELAQNYATVGEQLAALRASGFDDGARDQAQPILGQAARIRESLLSDMGQETDQRIQEFKAWIADSEARAIRSRERALAIFEGEIRNALEAAKSAESQSAYAEAAQAATSTIERAHQRGFADELSNLAEETQHQLDQLQSRWSTVASMKERLGDANNFDDYLRQLSRIQNLDSLSNAERRSIRRVLQALPSTESIKQRIILPDASNGWVELFSDQDYRRSTPTVTEIEKVFLQRLANDPVFTDVYESKVKYFEGDPVAKSEYIVFLVDPVSQTQTGVKSGINFTFKVRGFNEYGEPEPEAREMNFLSPADRSFWGFFYEPSELSEESKYYENTIRSALLQIIDGAPRLSALNLFEQLNKQRSLSYAFRAYWQSQLTTFLEMDPWKWGLALSPSLQSQLKELRKLPEAGASKRQWLSSIEQNSPSLLITEYFRMAAKQDLTEEAVAFARLYHVLNDGRIDLMGVADKEGIIQWKSSNRQDRNLYTIDQLTGRIESLASDRQPVPFAPVFTLSVDDRPALAAISKVEMATGYDLSREAYEPHLPPVIQ